MNPNDTTTSKIAARHLQRLAIVYVRQSTHHQVVEHRESADLQYQLTQRAADLGWAQPRILVIDEDQGTSAQAVTNRPGFQRLLAEVSLGRVGIILGREVSRLSRSNKDWHQLLELCGLFGVLIADAESVSDPADHNDRLLLGLRGMMSEAELQVLRGRLHQGKLNKARRGELFTCVPIGYVRCPRAGIALDPDEQVRAVVQLIFEKFHELGSVPKVNAYLVTHGVEIGMRIYKGPDKGDLRWVRCQRSTLYHMLSHPFYAGAYAYGRTRTDPTAKVREGRSSRLHLPQEEWLCLLQDRVPAYISWEQYLQNRQRMSENDRGRGASRRESGHAPTLLNGRVRCGRCGNPIQARNSRPGVTPRYACDWERLESRRPMCQSISARAVDALIEDLIFQSIEPASLELSIQTGQEQERDRQRLHQQWEHKLERASYQAKLAQRRYQAVDPENRLVAGTLEQEWEDQLTSLCQLEEDYVRFQQEQPRQLSKRDRDQIQVLAQDLPRLWEAETTTGADRRAVVRQLIEQVILTRSDRGGEIQVEVHWWGGVVSHHQVRQGVRSTTELANYDSLRDRLPHLRGEGKTGEEIAEVLNREGYHPARGESFTGDHVRRLLSVWGLSGQQRGVGSTKDLPSADEWWLPALAKELGEKPIVVHRWRWSGWLHTRQLPGKAGRWIVWADSEEVDRLRQLRAHEVNQPRKPVPVELRTPKERTKPRNPGNRNGGRTKTTPKRSDRK